MKKLILTLAILSIGILPANAQLGGILRRAAERTAEKAAEKAVDKAADNAQKAINDEIDKAFESKNNESTTSNVSSKQEAEATYTSLMQQAIDEMPTAQQFANHKSYELNEQTFKLLASPVTRYLTNLTMLTTRVFSLAYQDSAQVIDAAYDITSNYTGLSREEIDKLAAMSEEEQEAYLKAHYNGASAEAAQIKTMTEAAEYLKPLQPTIDKWEAAGKKADQILTTAESKCKTIYAKYAERLASASNDKTRNEIKLKYYNEILPIQRQAVIDAIKLRINEQLPIAESVEKEMVKIRAEHKDYVSQLLNYPQLTATQALTDASRLMEVPEY